MKINEHEVPMLACLHPIVIHKNGAKQLVPCGKCASCQLSKSNVATQVCHLEGVNSLYSLFGTLTYSDEYVPRFYKCPLNSEEEMLVKDVKEFNNITHAFVMSRVTRLFTDSYDEEHGKTTIYSSLSEESLDFIRRKQQLPLATYNFLYKPDIQRFFKRLNYYINYGRKEKIKLRYFYCGEYGPLHLRPHYHFVLFFDDLDLAKQCQSCIHKAWKFGRTDCQFSKDGSSFYVAGYVNSFACLPKDFQEISGAKPFCSKSIRLGFGFLLSQKSEFHRYEEREKGSLGAYESFFGRQSSLTGSYRISSFERVTYPRNGEYSEVFLYRYVKDWFFPRTLGFTQKDRLCVKEDFLLFDRVRERYGKEDDKTVAYYTRCIIEDIVNEWHYICELLKLTKDGKKVYWCASHGFDGLLANLLMCSPDLQCLRDLSTRNSDFHEWLLRVNKHPVPHKLVINENTNYDRLYSLIYRALHQSKHFINDIIEKDYTLVDTYLDIIFSYYTLQEIDYYRKVKEISECTFSAEFLKQMYPDTFDVRVYQKTDEYKYRVENCRERVVNRLKHKILNDSINLLNP